MTEIAPITGLLAANSTELSSRRIPPSLTTIASRQCKGKTSWQR
jgi:hypothetical protein